MWTCDGDVFFKIKFLSHLIKYYQFLYMQKRMIAVIYLTKPPIVLNNHLDVHLTKYSVQILL